MATRRRKKHQMKLIMMLVLLQLNLLYPMNESNKGKMSFERNQVSWKWSKRQEEDERPSQAISQACLVEQKRESPLW